MSGWIEWTGGGDCPVPKNGRPCVEIRYRGDNGAINSEQIPAHHAHDLRWEHNGGLGDILAYRIVGAASGVVKDTNPKDAAAVGRVPLHLVPDTLALFAAIGFAEGDSKYIAYNFRVAGVRVSVYVSALRRHLTRYYNGEWADKKTNVPHLASVACCVAILIDGHVTGIINDDRPPFVDLNDEFARAEEIIKHVYEMNKAVRPVGVEYRGVAA